MLETVTLPDALKTELFPWSRNLEVGVPLIDGQHEKLVRLLNMLANQFAHQAEAGTIDTVIAELADYAQYHFQTEEKIWGQYFHADDWEARHAQEHMGFVSTLSELKKKKSALSVNAFVEELLSFMTHWLASHILESDRRMALVVVAVQSGSSFEDAKRLATREMQGSIKALVDTILTMYDSLSKRTLQMMREIIGRQKAEERLRLAGSAFDNTLESICITDSQLNVIEANPSFYRANQCAPEEVIGKHLKTVKSGFAGEERFLAITQELGAKGSWRGEISSRAKSGALEVEGLTISCVKDELGVIINHVCVFSNITHLIDQQHQLKHMAHHDALTGLPNRLLLSDRLALAIAHAQRNGDFLAVCYLDLDGFKPVNDRFGHDAGDEVLRVTAQRLKKLVRGDDTVARMGGDEFVLLLGNQLKINNYADLLGRLLKDVALPVQIGNDSVSVTASIGVCFFPADGGDPESLLRRADEAMYQAKRSGKSKYFIGSTAGGAGAC